MWDLDFQTFEAHAPLPSELGQVLDALDPPGPTKGRDTRLRCVGIHGFVVMSLLSSSISHHFLRFNRYSLVA